MTSALLFGSIDTWVEISELQYAACNQTFAENSLD